MEQTLVSVHQFDKSRGDSWYLSDLRSDFETSEVVLVWERAVRPTDRFIRGRRMQPI